MNLKRTLTKRMCVAGVVRATGVREHRPVHCCSVRGRRAGRGRGAECQHATTTALRLQVLVPTVNNVQQPQLSTYKY